MAACRSLPNFSIADCGISDHVHFHARPRRSLRSGSSSSRRTGSQPAHPDGKGARRSTPLIEGGLRMIVVRTGGAIVTRPGCSPWFSSTDHQAAIDGQNLARDEGGAVGSQERDCASAISSGS